MEETVLTKYEENLDYLYSVFQTKPYNLLDMMEELCFSANKEIKSGECKNIRKYEDQYYDLSRFFSDARDEIEISENFLEQTKKRNANYSKLKSDFLEMENVEEEILKHKGSRKSRKTYFKELQHLWKPPKITDYGKFYYYNSEYATAIKTDEAEIVPKNFLTGKFGVTNIKLPLKKIKENKYPYLILFEIQ